MSTLTKSFKLDDETSQELLDIAKSENESLFRAFNRALMLGVISLRREIVIKQYSEKTGLKIHSVCCIANKPSVLAFYLDAFGGEEILLLCDEHCQNKIFSTSVKKLIRLSESVNDITNVESVMIDYVVRVTD